LFEKEEKVSKGSLYTALELQGKYSQAKDYAEQDEQKDLHDHA
jgi:hypothetical protein